MLKNRPALLVALPLLVVALSGCSSDGPGASPTTKSESQLLADAKAWDVANAQCLRVEGIDIDDPSESGGAPIVVDDDFDPDAFQAAGEKCQEQVTAKLGERPVSAAEKKQQSDFEDEMRETNECLRDKGYDAPDPVEGDNGSMISEAPDQEIPEDVLEDCEASAGSGSTGKE